MHRSSSIEAAGHLARKMDEASRPEFIVADARRLEDIPALRDQRGRFDGAACTLALMNIDPLEPVLSGVAALLKQGGVFVGVVMHPAFRTPGQTSWGYETVDKEATAKQGKVAYKRGSSPPPAYGRHADRPSRRRARERTDKNIAEPTPMQQYRRVDAYLSPAHREIVMNPGEVSSGKAAVTTITWHRPIQSYANAFANAGLLIDALEEWPSHRVTGGGPHAAEQDRARREIPMFLAMRGKKTRM